MSGIVRNLTASAAKLTGLFGRNFLYTGKQSYSTCWNCMKLSNVSSKYITPASIAQIKTNHYSTQNSLNTEIMQYLDKEIASEQESQSKLRPIPSELYGFEVHLDGSEITLVKKTDEERIEINLNINRSVDMDEDSLEEPKEDADVEDNRSLVSIPPFQIEIKRGDTILRLLCSFVGPIEHEYESCQEDNGFEIDEISIYKGEWQETNYVVQGDILDGSLYEMLFELLEEKGICRSFVVELSELCTAYEHASYVGLLRDLKKFVS